MRFAVAVSLWMLPAAASPQCPAGQYLKKNFNCYVSRTVQAQCAAYTGGGTQPTGCCAAGGAGGICSANSITSTEQLACQSSTTCSSGIADNNCQSYYWLCGKDIDLCELNEDPTKCANKYYGGAGCYWPADSCVPLPAKCEDGNYDNCLLIQDARGDPGCRLSPMMFQSSTHQCVSRPGHTAQCQHDIRGTSTNTKIYLASLPRTQTECMAYTGCEWIELQSRCSSDYKYCDQYSGDPTACEANSYCMTQPGSTGICSWGTAPPTQALSPALACAQLGFASQAACLAASDPSVSRECAWLTVCTPASQTTPNTACYQKTLAQCASDATCASAQICTAASGPAGPTPASTLGPCVTACQANVGTEPSCADAVCLAKCPVAELPPDWHTTMCAPMSVQLQCPAGTCSAGPVSPTFMPSRSPTPPTNGPTFHPSNQGDTSYPSPNPTKLPTQFVGANPLNGAAQAAPVSAVLFAAAPVLAALLRL